MPRSRFASGGCTEEEVERAVRTAEWQPAELGRSECRLALPFNKEWNGKHYATKTVRPIFAVEERAVVVVTAYVYYA